MNKNLLAFLASIIFSVLTINLIKILNLPTFVTFSIAVYSSYILMFFVLLHQYISQHRKKIK